MGKILAYSLICLACFVSTRLVQAQEENRFSSFFSGQEVPKELQKYPDLCKGTVIVFFGANWCIVQRAALKPLERSYTVKYFDPEKQVALYNYVRGSERRVPLTVIMVDGVVTKKYVGVHPTLRIRKEVSYKSDKSRFSNLLRRPIWLKKYADLWTCNSIVYFGNKYCSSCPSQRAILKGLEKEGYRVKYYDAHKDQALYDYLRKGEERVPLTIIFADGEIKKTFVGITSSLWIRPQAQKYKCDGDCNQCKDVNF